LLIFDDDDNNDEEGKEVNAVGFIKVDKEEERDLCES
jgi:hypothetical protein